MNASSFNISVHRKKDNVYLKLNGDYDTSSFSKLLQALENVILASIKFSSPGADIFFSFSTCAQVSPAKIRCANKDESCTEELGLTAKREDSNSRKIRPPKQAAFGAPTSSSNRVLQRLCLVDAV
jgi:hypothetical protein